MVAVRLAWRSLCSMRATVGTRLLELNGKDLRLRPRPLSERKAKPARGTLSELLAVPVIVGAWILVVACLDRWVRKSVDRE
jgi:hypothetical protein